MKAFSIAFDLLVLMAVVAALLIVVANIAAIPSAIHTIASTLP